jgi:hypothetical protein
MKKIIPGLVALALTVGVSAFTVQKHNLQESYDWTAADGTNPLSDATREEAIAFYNGCNQGGILCAKAFEVGTTNRVASQDLKKTS